MRRESGFSLIEVMIALTVLTVGLLAVGTGEITTLTLNKRTSESMKAAAAAENIIELMRRNSNKISLYNNLNTSNAAFATPATQDQFDFNDWKGQVFNAVGGIPQVSFECEGVLVPNALGTVTLVMGGRITTATVNIAWPARPCGITFITNIAS